MNAATAQAALWGLHVAVLTYFICASTFIGVTRAYFPWSEFWYLSKGWGICALAVGALEFFLNLAIYYHA